MSDSERRREQVVTARCPLVETPISGEYAVVHGGVEINGLGPPIAAGSI